MRLFRDFRFSPEEEDQLERKHHQEEAPDARKETENDDDATQNRIHEGGEI